jgi:hypothetical protein
MYRKLKLDKGRFMKKLLFALVCSFAFLSSSIQAFDKSDVVGSYIAIRPNDIGVMDQLQLHSDGTAYWWQSNALRHPITQGTFSPRIGTWNKDGNIVIVTTIGVGAAVAEPVGNCCDIDIAAWSRFTQKLQIIDKCTLQTIHRVARDFLLPTSQSPLCGDGIIAFDSTAVFQYKKVPVVPSDV